MKIHRSVNKKKKPPEKMVEVKKKHKLSKQEKFILQEAAIEDYFRGLNPERPSRR